MKCGIEIVEDAVGFITAEVECKVNPHSDEIDKTIKQIEKKVKAVDSEKNIHPYLVVFFTDSGRLHKKVSK